MSSPQTTRMFGLRAAAAGAAPVAAATPEAAAAPLVSASATAGDCVRLVTADRAAKTTPPHMTTVRAQRPSDCFFMVKLLDVGAPGEQIRTTRRQPCLGIPTPCVQCMAFMLSILWAHGG